MTSEAAPAMAKPAQESTPQGDHSSDEVGTIILRGVGKQYPRTERPAVQDVNLCVGAGEFITLLGPSGSGKSTTLSMIAGFTEPTTGSVTVDGIDMSRVKPHRRNLGVVFQQYALFPHMTVRDNISYPLRQRKVAKTEIAERVSGVLELLRLQALADRKPNQLSGGEQQRVALGRAVVYTPRALLLDEPLGALDKKLRDSLQREIARMHRELGMTFIMVTHDQEEALALSDRVAVFNEGKIEQVGTPTELYDKPETRFVAEFLGESNIFTGDVDTAARRLACGPMTLRLPADQAAGIGARASAIVRPERLTISASTDETVDHDHCRVHATVTDILYVGNRYRVGLTFADGTTGSAMRVADAPISVQPGDKVTASWPVDSQALVVS